MLISYHKKYHSEVKIDTFLRSSVIDSVAFNSPSDHTPTPVTGKPRYVCEHLWRHGDQNGCITPTISRLLTDKLGGGDVTPSFPPARIRAGRLFCA